jgi:glycerophosphoryl diester phosphodiesterase
MRTVNNAYNNLYPIPTLQEVIDLAKTRSIELGRPIGIYPETKYPTCTSRLCVAAAALPTHVAAARGRR